MRPWILVVASVLAGCGSRSDAPAAPAATGPAPSVSQGPAGGDYPSAFQATGLPAIARDGQSVVIAVMGEDGARSAPNLAVVEKDRTDAVVRTLVVQTADEGEVLIGDETQKIAATPGRLAEANRFLTESHGQRGWIALAPMTLEQPSDDEGYGTTHRAEAGGVAIHWDEGRVKVTVGGTPVVDRATEGWTAPTRKLCEECDECSNPSFLGGAWIDVERELVLARISYIGNDSCWEPDSQDHVVSW